MTTAPKREVGSLVPDLPGWGALDAFALGDPDEPPALQWPMSVRTFSKMRKDTQIDSLCNSVTMPLFRMKFEIDPNGARDEVVSQISTDLGIPIVGSTDPAPRSRRRFKLRDHLEHAVLALWYGHMFFEMVPDTQNFDLAKDGWRLRKLAPRMPDSLQSISVAPDGGLLGITQYGWQDSSRRGPLSLVGSRPQIPVDSLAAYIWRREGANWRGRSMLRPLYPLWVLKDRALRVDAMKNERFGMGIPTGRAPEGGDPAQYASLAQAMRAGEAAGVGLPPGADIGVEGVRGTLPDVLASIRYYDESMARSFMAMIVQLGQTQTGSRALGNTFQDFFQGLIEAVADWYVGNTNEHVIEDMVDWNWDEDTQAPLLKWSYPADQEPLAISDLVAMVDKKIITMDPETEAFVRRRSNLPELSNKIVIPDPSAPAPGVPAAPADGASPGAPSAANDAPLDSWAQDVAASHVAAHLPGQHNQKDHGRGTSNIQFASKEEWDAALAQATAKIAAAPVPSAKDVEKARADLKNAKRAGGDSRGGSSKDRAVQRENLFKEFGGEEKGYVVDHGTGMKLHWTDDPAINKKGYPILERGKIFVKHQGGAYRLSNLLPESFVTNRSRNDTPVRQENLD